MSPRKRGEGKTPIRPLRVEDDLWERFGAATQQLGTDRSAWLRGAILWCLREPGAKMPQRAAPAAQLDSMADS
jgi:hypothetical protein